MSRFDRSRRALATLALGALLLAPLSTRALAGSEPDTGESKAGVVFAVICGASVSINRMAPGTPIVVAVGAFSCAMMVALAWAEPDVP